MIDESCDRFLANLVRKKGLQHPGKASGNVGLEFTASFSDAGCDRCGLLVGPFGPLLPEPDGVLNPFFGQFGFAIRQPCGVAMPIGLIQKLGRLFGLRRSYGFGPRLRGLRLFGDLRLVGRLLAVGLVEMSQKASEGRTHAASSCIHCLRMAAAWTSSRRMICSSRFCGVRCILSAR